MFALYPFKLQCHHISHDIDHMEGVCDTFTDENNNTIQYQSQLIRFKLSLMWFRPFARCVVEKQKCVAVRKLDFIFYEIFERSLCDEFKNRFGAWISKFPEPDGPGPWSPEKAMAARSKLSVWARSIIYNYVVNTYISNDKLLTAWLQTNSKDIIIIVLNNRKYKM